MRLVRYSPYQFSLFRSFFGLYLFVYFVLLMPYGVELFSTAGGMTQVDYFRLTWMPNILLYATSSIAAVSFLLVMALASLALASGFYRRVAALVLWYGLACLFTRNPTIYQPGFSFLAWLCLALAIIPSGEPWAIRSRASDTAVWWMPKALYWGAWTVLALFYLTDAFTKLTDPAWSSGMGFVHMLAHPFARPAWLELTWQWVPRDTAKLISWSLLGVELLFAPLAFVDLTRKFAWSALIVFHLFYLGMMNIGEVFFQFLVFHLFIVDNSWFPGRKSVSAPVVYFDGVCGLCNYFVDFLLDEDYGETLVFSPLQGELAKANEIVPPGTIKFNTVVYVDESGRYEKSDAVLEILKRIGGVWRPLSYLARPIPRVIRNAVYDHVASHRYQWFGRRSACRIPTAEERARFRD